jgi:hypothetical protein
MCHHKIREYVTVAHFLIMDLVEKHGMAGRPAVRQARVGNRYALFYRDRKMQK